MMNYSKKYFLLFTLLLISFSNMFAVTKKEAQVLLKQAQDNTAFYESDFSGNYKVVQDKPGEGKTSYDALMYRRDKEAKWTILITGPAHDKGKGYLQYDSNIWFFDPADRRFTFTSSRDRFQNTNANNSDFAPQRFEQDYSIESFTEEKLGKFDCIVFSLKAKVKNVDYPGLKLWISKDDGLLRKKEDYSLTGQKLRTTAIPSYQNISSGKKSRKLPVSMVIQDNLRGKKIDGKLQYERTVISISNVKIAKVEDSVYTKPYLEMMSAK